MGSSIEMPKGLKIVCGDMAYDAEKETIECPPSTVNNKKMLPKYRVPMQEGEMEINLVETTYKRENGKIVSYYKDGQEIFIDNENNDKIVGVDEFNRRKAIQAGATDLNEYKKAKKPRKKVSGEMEI